MRKIFIYMILMAFLCPHESFSSYDIFGEFSESFIKQKSDIKHYHTRKNVENMPMYDRFDFYMIPNREILDLLRNATENFPPIDQLAQDEYLPSLYSRFNFSGCDMREGLVRSEGSSKHYLGTFGAADCPILTGWNKFTGKSFLLHMMQGNDPWGRQIQKLIRNLGDLDHVELNLISKFFTPSLFHIMDICEENFTPLSGILVYDTDSACCYQQSKNGPDWLSRYDFLKTQYEKGSYGDTRYFDFYDPNSFSVQEKFCGGSMRFLKTKNFLSSNPLGVVLDTETGHINVFQQTEEFVSLCRDEHDNANLTKEESIYFEELLKKKKEEAPDTDYRIVNIFSAEDRSVLNEFM